MVRDSGAADEQPRGDLRVGGAFAGQARDQRFLRGKGIWPLDGGLPGLPAGGPQFGARPFGKRRGANRVEDLVRAAELIAGVAPAPLAAQPRTVPGYLANDIHFENPDASGGNTNPRYATIYDIIAPDPATAWPGTEHSPAYPAQLFSDPRARLVSPTLRASYALVGSQLQPGQHGPLTGIHVILSNGGADTERQQREAQILETGLFYSAARFRINEGSPDPAEWLEVFETDDPDPLHAYPQATSRTLPAPRIQPRLSESFRLAGACQTNGV